MYIENFDRSENRSRLLGGGEFGLHISPKEVPYKINQQY